MDVENPWDSSVDKPFGFLNYCIKKIGDQAGPEDVDLCMLTADLPQSTANVLNDIFASSHLSPTTTSVHDLADDDLKGQIKKLNSSLSVSQGETQVPSEAIKQKGDVDFFNVFESIADQYEKNNEMETLIYKLETLNRYPHVLGKKSIDQTSTAIQLLSNALDYIIERQTELCERLTAVPSEEDANQVLHVKADDQENVLNSFAQIVMFVNNMKDLMTNIDMVPSMSAALEELLPRLTLSGDSLSQLEIQFDGIENARSVLEVMTQLRSAFDS